MSLLHRILSLVSNREKWFNEVSIYRTNKGGTIAMCWLNFMSNRNVFNTFSP